MVNGYFFQIYFLGYIIVIEFSSIYNLSLIFFLSRVAPCLLFANFSSPLIVDLLKLELDLVVILKYPLTHFRLFLVKEGVTLLSRK